MDFNGIQLTIATQTRKPNYNDNRKPIYTLKGILITIA